jgi:hypothetical protein
MKTYPVANVVLAVFAAIVATAVAGVTIAAIIVNSDQNSLQRFCVTFEDKVRGHFSLKSNERQMLWDLQYKALPGVVTALSVHGPLQPGLDDADLAVALCGMPSTMVCDLAVAGRLSGGIIETYTGGPLKPVIQAIRKEPAFYYVLIDTTGGSVKMPLNSLCGTP